MSYVTENLRIASRSTRVRRLPISRPHGWRAYDSELGLPNQDRAAGEFVWMVVRSGSLWWCFARHRGVELRGIAIQTIAPWVKNMPSTRSIDEAIHPTRLINAGPLSMLTTVGT